MKKAYRRNSLRIAYGITMLVLLLTGSASALYDSEAQYFLGLINNYRAQNNLGRLIVDAKLQESANWMSNDMLSNCVTGKYTCSHTDSTGSTFVQRLRDFGYPAGLSASAAENIAWGFGGGASSAQQAFDLWKNSQGHRTNMLGSSFVAISISRSCSAGDCAWVTDFGSIIVKPLNNDPTPTGAPKISSFDPVTTTVTNNVGESRTFSIKTNQTVNVSWLINGTEAFNEIGVITSSYANSSAALGVWNVSVLAQNTNGSGMQTWIWNVPRSIIVDIRDNLFSNSIITIPVNSQVTWINSGSAAHTVTADDRSFNSGNLVTNQRFTLNFIKTGTFTYHCNIHPAMTGTVIVTSSLPTTGDINGNGQLTLVDAIYLAKHVGGFSGYEIIYADGDINANGQVTLVDEIYLAKHVGGFIGYEKIY